MRDHYRTTLSIPLDLYKRLKSEATFNWSAVASSALAKALDGGDEVGELRKENEELKREVIRLQEMLWQIANIASKRVR